MSANQHYSIHNPPTECRETNFEGEVTTIPYEWSGKTEQTLLVQGLVVAVGKTALNVAITHIHEDTWSSSSLYQEVGSQLWFQQIENLHYRELLSLSSSNSSDIDFSNVKRRTQEYPVYEDDLEILPGDTVHVHRTVFWSTRIAGVQTGLSVTDVCRLPTPNVDVEEGLQKLSDRTVGLAKQLVRSAQKREHVEMVSHPRIQPNKTFRPFEDTTDDEFSRLTDRRVFGHGPVKDHFVDVRARRQPPGNQMLQGSIRFTQQGDVTLIPNIMPFGEGSEEDPLMEISVKIHSTTVLNKAVGEQQAYVLIDGVKYTAFVDPEISSQYFENPGHEVVFGGFRADDQAFDCFWLTDEQKEAYFRKSERESELTRRIINEAVNAGKIPTGNASAEIVEEIKRRLTLANALATEDEITLNSIKRNVLSGTMNTGAPLMIPRSKLDSIEIVLPSVGD